MNRDSAKKAPAPRLRARLKEATAEAIRAAAEQVLIEQGMGARMEDIAERAGVSVGTLYNHFEDRTALLRELLRTRREVLLAKMDGVMAEVDGRPFREQLERVLTEVFAHFREHAAFFSLALQSEALRIPLVPAQGGTLMELTARLERLIVRGVVAGEVRSEGAEFHASLLVGMVRALLLRSATDTSGAPLERGAAVMLQVFLKGIEV